MSERAVQEYVTAVILAGGKGTRISHLLGDLPKPMAPVAGLPFLEWVLRFLVKQGVRRAVISTGHRAEAIETHFANWRGGMELIFAREQELLGTAGGFLNAAGMAPREWNAQAWLVLNGDSLVVGDWSPLFEASRKDAVDGAILAVDVPDASRFGTLECASDMRLRRFAEKRPGRGLINGGVYLLHERLRKHFSSRRPLSFETDVFPELLERHRIQAVPVMGDFLDIGVPETLDQADAFVRSHRDWFGSEIPAITNPRV
ncbi:MAG: nucleotidyltransferase family protein [Verrucomicrobiota bacterium]